MDLMNRAMPKLADLGKGQTKYYAGDRIIARVSVELKSDARKKVIKGVDQWANVAVNTLIINCFNVEIIRRNRIEPHRDILVAGVDFFVLSDHPNEVKLSCSRVELIDTDLLEVATRTEDPIAIKKIFLEIGRWAGIDTELIRMPWRA
jgi:hypothetical protein